MLHILPCFLSQILSCFLALGSKISLHMKHFEKNSMLHFPFMLASINKMIMLRKRKGNFEGGDSHARVDNQ